MVYYITKVSTKATLRYFRLTNLWQDAITKDIRYNPMSNSNSKRCSVCDLSSSPGMNLNHPLFLSAPSTASYQQSLLATTFYKDTTSGETICEHCLQYQELENILLLREEPDLLDEGFDE